MNLFFRTLTLLPLSCAFAQESLDWQNPKALHQGTEKPHTTMIACPTKEHTFQMPQRKTTTLNLDLVQMGGGGDNSWGAKPHKEFQIPSDVNYSYIVRLQPYDKATFTPPLAAE